MLKILFVTDSLGNGGAERQLALLAQYLPGQVERYVWAMDDGPFSEILSSQGIPVYAVLRRRRLDITPAFNLWKLAADIRPHIIHSWGWMSALAAVPVCKKFNIPLVDSTIRMGRRPPRRANMSQFILRFADRVIANSQAGLNAWAVDSTRGRVIYNGFDPKRFPLTQDEKFGDGRFRVIMTGRMAREKDYPSFIDAARILACQGDRWRFIALGNGPQRETCLAYARDLVAAGVLEFPEPGLEVLKWVRQANVGVLLTNPEVHAEGCSNSILEYMACGLPVVCTEGGGNREVVIDRQTGYIIPANGAKSLADALLTLRNDPFLAAVMGRNAKDRLKNFFSVDQLVQNMLSVYHEVAPTCAF